MSTNENQSYESAGVDIHTANETLKAYAELAKKTMNENVLADIGPFGSVFKLSNYKEPVLVSSTDGVGTKLLLAKSTDRLSMMGEDLVNHCVNDVMCAGATPLFFLDYIGAGPNLSQEDRIELVKGMTKACLENDVALVGGETADLPDLYLKNAFDIVGFMLGASEKNKIVDGSKISAGDILYAIPSKGLQTNGFSMIRKIWNLNGEIEHDSKILSQKIDGLDMNLGDSLMQPHLSFKNVIDELIYRNHDGISGIAHITGGGIALNLERIIPAQVKAVVDLSRYEIPAIYKIIHDQSSLSDKEMFEIFNMGIGMILVINKESLPLFRGIIDNFIEIGFIEKNINKNDKVEVILE
ncbi:MAG: phosphoribosylformylglycinamidine cyclo-ligase [Dehalococcoidia bacterium]|jgi:phosphoribosylformylglycinamidine cyclo-ligase|nr:MAG: phosphoribosylformylglycinamidine cyclo-ligase [Chloroflexota bacterium]|tara:strand:+ start:4762 stop:5823 length:1062 start_codon:yes stop_codon:yes gene_type:complete